MVHFRQRKFQGIANLQLQGIYEAKGRSAIFRSKVRGLKTEKSQRNVKALNLGKNRCARKTGKFCISYLTEHKNQDLEVELIIDEVRNALKGSKITKLPLTMASQRMRF